MKKLLLPFWHYLETISVHAGDSLDLKRRKLTLVVIAGLSSLTGVITGTQSYIVNGIGPAVYIPYAYSTFIGATLIIYFNTKNIRHLLIPFLLMILIVPILFQWSIGGLTSVGSTPILLWGLLAPLGALMFQSVSKAKWWFLTYIFFVLMSLFMDNIFLNLFEPPENPISQSQIVIGHGLNIIFLAFTLFMTMLYFVNAFQNERDRADNLVLDLQKTNFGLNEAMKELKATQAELIQSEKMASLGQLTAGIAHEINNPIGAMCSANELTHRCLQKINNALEECNTIEEVREHKAIQKSLQVLESNRELIGDASSRVADLVKSLKNFAQLDEAEFKIANIHHSINNSLKLINNKIEGRIKISKEYGDLPDIMCYSGLLNQVFMNIFLNSIDAIEEKGAIHIKTWEDESMVHIKISDTGKGISPGMEDKIFDFKFSKNQSRVKMSSGLPCAYRIIQKHNGAINIQNRNNGGAAVSIQIPKWK